MILKCRVDIDFCFWLRSGKKIPVKDSIEQVYDEESDEYVDLCNQYEGDIGFKRKGNEKVFDLELVKIISEGLKQLMKERFDGIVNTYTDLILGRSSRAYANIGGVVINLTDVSAIKAEDFKTNVSKE